MKRKIVLAFLSLIMVLALIAAGCSEPVEPTATTEAPAATTEAPAATTEAPAATTEAPAATEEPEKVYEFRLSSYLTDDATEPWVNAVEEAAGGRIDIVVYANSSLVAAADTAMGLRDGICDIALHPIEMAPEMYPLNNILTMPFMPLGDLRQQHVLWYELQDKFPELKAEFDEFQVIFDDTTGGNVLHTVGRQVIAPEDVEGMRIQAAGTTGDIMIDLGATPLYLGVPDWFTSLDRGLLDGMWLPWDAVYVINVYPLLPYHTTFYSLEGMLMRNTLMNKDAWNSLPADLQKVILDTAPTEREAFWNRMEAIFATAQDAIRETGGTIYDLNPEETSKWYDVALPQHEAYVEKVDAMGLPGTEVYEEALRLGQELSN